MLNDAQVRALMPYFEECDNASAYAMCMLALKGDAISREVLDDFYGEVWIGNDLTRRGPHIAGTGDLTGPLPTRTINDDDEE